MRSTLRLRPLLLAALLPLASAAAAHAALDFNEAVSGDLSNLGSAPTPLTFSLGVNRVSGTMGGPPEADPDIFTFTLQPGWQLTSIFLGPMNPQERSFFGLAAGPTIDTTSSENHLASHLTYSIGELMPELALGGNFSGTGFTAPLGPGTYTAWFQEISARVDYTFEYTVVTIPEPASAATLTALVALGFISLRRSRPAARG